MTSATFKVQRPDHEGDHDDVEVTVEGRFQYESSYNPNEHGVHLFDWDVVEPHDIVLTAAESEQAVQALYDAR